MSIKKMNEFDLIAKYFAPLSIDGLKDDAAVLKIPDLHELVVSSDTLNEGTHFWPGAVPGDIAHKALRASLSDLAAMGADPLSYQLNIAFPEKPGEDWLAAFTKALAADQKEFGIQCSGGDTTSIQGPLSISITALGIIPIGRAVTRSNAKAGHDIILTGPVGDAFIGLEILRGHIDTTDKDHFLQAYNKPNIALNASSAIRKYAQAAVDISDGLLADIGHVANASGVQAIIDAHKVPLSEPASGLLAQGKVTLEQLFTGGDDYAVACAVPPEHSAVFLDALKTHNLHGAVIGHFEAGAGVTVRDEAGEILPLKPTGWSYF